MDWLVLTSGWLLAAIGWGMWLQDQLWLRRVDWVPRAPDAAEPGVEGTYLDPEELAEQQLLRMDREQWITETMNEANVDRSKAEEEVDRIMAELGL